MLCPYGVNHAISIFAPPRRFEVTQAEAQTAALCVKREFFICDYRADLLKRRTGKRLLERGGVFRRDFNHEAGERFGIKQLRAEVERSVRAQLATDAHFGQRHGDPTFRTVMAGAHQPGGNGFVHDPHHVQRVRHRLRHCPAADAVNQVEMAAAKFVAGRADDVEQIAMLFQIGRDGVGNVRHDAQRRNQQRAGDGVARAVYVGVLVVQAVLAGDERRAICQRRVVAALRAADETA
jgi:hypothetical protein